MYLYIDIKERFKDERGRKIIWRRSEGERERLKSGNNKTRGKSGWSVYGSPCIILTNFSVSSKLYQNKNLFTMFVLKVN